MKKKTKKEIVGLSAVVLASIMLIVGSSAATAKKVTIRYMSWYVGEQGKIEEGWLKLWKAKHPNIQVKKISPPAADLEYQEKLFAMIAGGRPPDVPVVDTWNSQGFYRRGVCVDLEPLIERDKIDLNMFREPFVEEGRSAYDDKLYGLPWGPGYWVVVINKDIFDKEGVAYPQKGWTLDDFVALGKKFTKDFDGDGIIDQWGISNLEAWHSSSPFAFMNGGRFLNRETGKVDIAEPEFTSMFQFVADLDLKHHVMPSLSEQLGIAKTGAEITGRFAMWVTLDCYAASIYKKMDLKKKFDWGMTYLPKGKAPIVSFGKGNSIVMMKATKHPEEAWEFLKWSIGDEAQAYLAENLIYPATKKGAQLPEFLSPSGLYPNLLEPSVFPTENRRHVPYDVPGWTEVFWKVFVPKCDLIWLGKKTAAETMKEMEPECNRILEQAHKEMIEIRKVIEAVE